MDHRGRLPRKLSRLRSKLGRKAKQEPGFRFYALYGHILRPDVLQAAWEIVRDSKGGRTPGVDGVTVDHIVNGEGGVGKFLAELEHALRTKSFVPDPVKRVMIPKANGQERPLGIPTIRDRVVQMAILLLLEPIFEADFLDCSYGFRPGRSAKDAVAEITSNVWKDYRAIYDADLKGYFDSIPHDKLMKGLEQRISDRSMLRLIRLFLRAPVQEGNGPPRRSDSGTPQGGVISPLLANSFLHWFDRAFYSRSGPGTWAKARLVRYADDFVIMARFLDGRVEHWVEQTIESRLGLELNRAKTRTLNMEDEGTILEFLGYSFRWSRSHRSGGGPRYVRVEASKKARAKARAKLRDLTGPRFCFLPPEDVVMNMNRFLRGWLAYFSMGHPTKVRWDLVRFAEDRVARHLRRRSQRPYRPPKGVPLQKHAHALGLIALTAGGG
ncbi:MAG: group II intron reverse transcriptase/maturase [Myxococcota bacterium]